MPKTVVLALEDTSESYFALDFVGKFLIKEGDLMRIIHVQKQCEHIDGIQEAGILEPVYSAGKVSDESIQMIDKWVKRCRELGISHFKEDVVAISDGSIGKTICSHIASLQKVDQNIMLVLAPRHRSSLEKYISGSVSEFCLKWCPCSVLIAKSP